MGRKSNSTKTMAIMMTSLTEQWHVKIVKKVDDDVPHGAVARKIVKKVDDDITHGAAAHKIVKKVDGLATRIELTRAILMP